VYYQSEDTDRLLSAVPFMQLARPSGALRFLQSVVATGDELKHLLGLYPHVRYEALDFHYVCQQSLAALDTHLMEDLINHKGWPGFIWAILLMGLTQDAAGLQYFARRYHDFPHNQWIVDEIHAALSAQADVSPSPFGELVGRLRDQLKPLPKLAISLRRTASPEVQTRKAAAVRAAYQKGDLKSALMFARD
jgi:hypothetical protein